MNPRNFSLDLRNNNYKTNRNMPYMNLYQLNNQSNF